MKKSGLLTLAAAVALLAPAFAAREAQALPSFSRQYKAECTTCHTIIPERNEFGEAFEKNSYVWPSAVPLPATNQKPEAGASEEKKVAGGLLEQKNEALWLSGIPEIVPIAIMASHEIDYNNARNPRNGDRPKLDLDAENEFEIMAAGTFQNKVGFMTGYDLTEQELGEVFAQFRHPLDLPLNVKVGRFKPKLSLWKENNVATISGYGYNDFSVGKSDSAAGNPFTIAGTQGGVEVNSVIGSRVFAAAGVTNGPRGEGSTTPPRNLSRNGKDYYGHLSVRLLGTDFLGREPDVNLEGENSILDYLTLTVGGFGYVGASRSENAPGVIADNDFYRTGIESEALYKRLRVRVAGIFGRDDKPTGDGEAQKSRLFLAHAEYLVGSKGLVSLRYEYQNIEREGITRSYIPTLVYTPLQNLKLAVEYRHETRSLEGTNNQATGQIVFVF